MMNPDNPPNWRLAMRQWKALNRSYRRHGLSVQVMDGQLGLEDMVFVANAGLPVREYFILSNFLENERRREKSYHRNHFGTVYGFDKIISLTDYSIFEGQGDALFMDNKTLLLGYGVRTNEKAVEELSLIIHGLDPEITIVPLSFRSVDCYPLEEDVFYHLDTCLLYLKKINTFLVYPRPFQDGSLNTLRQLGDVVEVSKEEAGLFVCNSVIVKDIVFAPKIGRCQSKDLMVASGYRVLEHDTSEFIKSGGAVKCLSLEMKEKTA
jgi:N-dimethylarginine dimethylaminohydrolase